MKKVMPGTYVAQEGDRVFWSPFGGGEIIISEKEGKWILNGHKKFSSRDELIDYLIPLYERKKENSSLDQKRLQAVIKDAYGR